MPERVCWVQRQTPSSWKKLIASVLCNWHRLTSHGMKTREGWEQGLVHSSEVSFICCGVKGTHSFHGQKQRGATYEPYLACYASRVCRQQSSAPGHFPHKASLRDKQHHQWGEVLSVGTGTWCEHPQLRSDMKVFHWEWSVEPFAPA